MRYIGTKRVLPNIVQFLKEKGLLEKRLTFHQLS